MSTWHWITRGCAANSTYRACATCGYRIQITTLGGACPECNVPYINLTLHERGPTPPIGWRAAWTIGPIVVTAVALLLWSRLGANPAMTLVGIMMMGASVGQHHCLSWYVDHTLSDVERDSVGLWCLTVLWMLTAWFNVLVGTVMVLVGIAACFN